MAKPSILSPPVTLYGRNDLKAWLGRMILAENRENGLKCPLVLLYGSNGMGKSAVCREFIQEQLGSPPSIQPLVAFHWKGGIHTRSVPRFARLLFEMGATNLPIDAEQNTRLAADSIGSNLSDTPSISSHISSPDQTYREDGAAEDVLPSIRGVSDSDQKGLAEEFIHKLVNWTGEHFKNPTFRLLGKVVFVFDDFAEYHVAIRQWVGRYLYPEIRAANVLPGCAYLFTGKRPWDQCGFADYWEISPGALKEYRIEPLTPSDCKRWLQDVGMKEEYLEVLFEETEGIPLQIAALLEQPGALESMSQSGAIPEPLRQFSARERRWLHAAAMQSALNCETFELLLGRNEATEALAWLRRQPLVCQVDTRQAENPTIQVSPHIRNLILQRAKEKIPLRHKEYANRLELMRQFSAKVPVQQHRRYLELLSPVSPISKEVIHYVYGED